MFNALFEIINVPLSYILGFFSNIFGGSFAAAVFVFTIFINLALIPLSIKSQKASVNQLRVKPKLDELKKKWHNLECKVYAVKNNFFGGKIDVAGLVTATDIYEQLKDKDLGEEMLIPSVMLRSEGDMFLDSVTVCELSEKLNVKITPVNNGGYELIDRLIGR